MSFPAILNTNPSSNETNVAINVKVQVQFNQLMLESTLNTSTLIMFRTQDMSPVLGSITYNTQNSTVTFLPAHILLKNTNYTFIVAGDDPLTTTVVENSVKNFVNEPMQNNVSWSFVTGSDIYRPHEDPQPETQPDQPTADRPTVTVLLPKVKTNFAVIDTIPDNQDTNLDVGLDKVSVYFNRHIDASYLDNSWMMLNANPVLGETSDKVAAITPSGYLTTSPSGIHWNKHPGDDNKFKENNEIVVTLSNQIKASGTSEQLSANEQFMFTTRFNPLYSTVKKVQLEAGPIVMSVPEDTINRIIHENSLLAYNLGNPQIQGVGWPMNEPTFTATQFVKHRSSYDVLHELMISLLNGLGDSKRLGDFSVQKMPGIAREMEIALSKSIDSIKYWLRKLTLWSRDNPKAVVKGSHSPTTPPIRGVRTWKRSESVMGGNLRQDRARKLPGRKDSWS